MEGPPLSIAPVEPLLPTMSRISSASVLPLAVKTFANGVGGSGALQGGVRGGQGHAQGPPNSGSPPRGDHGADDGGIMAGGSRPYGSTTVMRPRGGGGSGAGVGCYPSQDPLTSGELPQWRCACAYFSRLLGMGCGGIYGPMLVQARVNGGALEDYTTADCNHDVYTLGRWAVS